MLRKTLRSLANNKNVANQVASKKPSQLRATVFKSTFSSEKLMINRCYSTEVENAQTETPVLAAAPQHTRTRRAKVDDGTAVESLNMDNILMHPSMWSLDRDPTGYYLAEKFDGIRCYWNGQAFYSRQGKKLKNVPAALKEGLPSNIALDGELWIGRDQYLELGKAVRSIQPEKWINVTYKIFDVVKIHDRPGNLSLDERLRILDDLKSQVGSRSSVVSHVLCEGREHFQSYFQNIVENKGEGVILKETGSVYTAGRSPTLLKYKHHEEDDVKFIQTVAKCHALECEQLDGQKVIVGCPAQTYEHPPKSGAILNVKHSGYHKTTNKMRHPFYVRVRQDDMDWSKMQEDRKRELEQQIPTEGAHESK